RNSGNSGVRMADANGNVIEGILGGALGTLWLNYTSTGNVLLAHGGGNVGIGTTGPTDGLEVNKNWWDSSGTDWGGGIKIRGTAPSISFWDTDNTAQNFMIHTNSNQMNFYVRPSGGSWNNMGYFNASGQMIFNSPVGIGAVPSYSLHVNGSIAFNGALFSLTRSNFFLNFQTDRNMVLYDNGSAIWQSGTSTSDIRLKKDIQELKGLLPKVLKWRAVSFKFKDPQSGTEPQIGLIAQEVEPAFPELIFTDKKGYKLIDYPKVTVVLLGALQEQQRQLEALQADLASLKQKIKGK
ncbi:MAG: tail fiber domain-containing protein, partial [Candidatus Omnitrophota bacterium]